MTASRARRALLWAAVVTAAVTTTAAAFADRLHLEGGGTIDTDDWWIEGDRLLYRSEAGTIGIPRSAVLQIERGEPAARRPAAAGRTEVPDPGPRRPPADLARLLAEGRAALDRAEFEAAADLYGEALRLADPDVQLPRVGYALSRIALGDDALAAGVVLDGLARDPHHPGLLELLGDLRNREERVADAVSAWRSAFERAPSDRLRHKIEKAERELEVGRYYDLTTTSHFNLRYDGDVDRELTAAVTTHLEQRFWTVADELAHTPPQPITVLLYPRRQFRDVTQAPEWVGGLYDGKIRVPLGGLRRLDPPATAVLTHELTHAIVHSKTRGHCPRWLHEGLAQRFEGKRLGRADRDEIRRRLAAGDPADWESRGFSYPLALSLTLHLEARNGFHRVVDLLEELGRGASLDDALRAVYGFDYAALCRSWGDDLDAPPER